MDYPPKNGCETKQVLARVSDSVSDRFLDDFGFQKGTKNGSEPLYSGNSNKNGVADALTGNALGESQQGAGGLGLRIWFFI